MATSLNPRYSRRPESYPTVATARADALARSVCTVLAWLSQLPRVPLTPPNLIDALARSARMVLASRSQLPGRGQSTPRSVATSPTSSRRYSRRYVPHRSDLVDAMARLVAPHVGCGAAVTQSIDRRASGTTHVPTKRLIRVFEYSKVLAVGTSLFHRHAMDATRRQGILDLAAAIHDTADAILESATLKVMSNPRGRSDALDTK